MDGLSRTTGAGTLIEYREEWIQIHPLRLRDFGLFENILLNRVPNTEFLEGIAPKEMRDLFQVPVETMFAWLGTEEGLAISLWSCMRGERSRNWCTSMIDDDLFREAFVEARDRISGLSVSGFVDWPLIKLLTGGDDDQGEEEWKPTYTKVATIQLQTNSVPFSEISEWTLYQLRAAISEPKNFDGRLTVSRGSLPR